MFAANPRARVATRRNPEVESVEPRTVLSGLTLAPVADSYARAGFYSATNYGATTQLGVSNQLSSNNDRESFLKFDLSALSAPVRTATLQFTIGAVGSDVANAGFRVSIMADAQDSWVEGNNGADNKPSGELVWNNRPTGALASSTFPGTKIVNGARTSIDVTSLINQAANTNKIATLRLDAPAQVNNAQQFLFWSREAAGAPSRPALVVELDAPDVQAAWPDRVFAPYVDTTNWPLFDFVSMSRNVGVKHFTLAFIVADTAKQPSWGGYYPVADRFRADEIAALRALGGDVMVSFGGAAGTELAVALTDLNALTNAYQTVIETYSLTQIDFDIEGAWVADKPSIDRRSSALKTLQDRAKAAGKPLEIWLTLPVLPQGLTSDGLYVVKSAIAAGVDLAGVNVMAMDYGDSAAPNPEGQMGKYAIDAGTSLFQQLKTAYANAGLAKSDAALWSMVGITPMIGQNDVPSERFYQADARQLLDFALQKQIGYLAFWSANRDNGSVPKGQLSNIGSGVNQTPFEFSQIIKPFTGNNMPMFSVDDVSIVEGDSGTKTMTFNVSLAAPATQTVSVNYATINQSATAGADFQAKSGTIAFAPGEIRKTVAVAITGDTLAEPNETFELVLSQPVNAGLLKSKGLGTILDDDAPPAISINDLSLAEGQSGTRDAGFIVTLSRAPKANETVSVKYATADGTAKAPADYQASDGTLVFNTGELSKTVVVPVAGDTLQETDETFFVNLSAPVGATLARAQGKAIIADNDTPSDQVKFEVTSQWDGGFIGQVTIKNTTNKAWVGWTLEWDAAFSIANIWSAQLTSVANGHFVIKPLDWTRQVNPGATITFGFEAAGKAAPPSGMRLTPLVG